jgi:hypothetical protein
MREAIRQAVTTAIDAPFALAFPGVPLVFKNAPFDYNNAPEVYAECEIEFLASSQIGAAAAPKTRTRGYVYVSVATRQGLGTARANAILAWFADTLQYNIVGGAQMQAAEDDGSSERKGWAFEFLKVPFHADP